MNVILVGTARNKAVCLCCGSPAQTNVRFEGPDAKGKVSLDLCAPCRRLLGHLLVDQPRTTHQQVS